MIDVIIVTRDSEETISRALDSCTNLRVIIVDNASRDSTLEVVRNHSHQEIELIPNARNVGFGAAANQGAAIARGHYLLFCNPDAWFSSDLPSALARAIDASGAWAVGPRILDEEGRCNHSARAFPLAENAYYNRRWFARGGSDRRSEIRRFLMLDRDHSSRFAPDWLSGALFMATAEEFTRLGGFDERYFLFYEEVDLFRRASELGLLTWYEGGLTGGHEGGVSMRRAAGGAAPRLIAGYVLYYRRWLREGLHTDLRVAWYLTRSVLGEVGFRLAKGTRKRRPSSDCMLGEPGR